MYEKEISEYRKEKKKSRNAVVLVLVAIILILVAGIGGFFISYYMTHKKKEPEITSSFVESKIELVSDLTTAELSYSGVIHYEEGEIPFIDKKTYNMTYTAEVKAGINMDEIQVDIQGDKVDVTLPEPEIQGIKVDSNSVQFYDESFALFNWDSKEDGVKAISEAEKDVEEHADVEELKIKAKKQSVTIIQELLDSVLDDKEVYVH